ncbi:MAG: di-trans,poly-cis-decaprenylcistransferase [Rikenellaceae bacterium]|jgi:undecaprenyl diphosphate synthase|nr:di-trans,poly-cis-decaprenylcistransferase [Rikenellaceae bacterium]
MEQRSSLPEHVAIIMDGNGRWAQLRGHERAYGHTAGVESVRRVIRAAARRGVRYLTLYTFSTENWGRPAEEVEALMELFCRCVIDETPELQRERTSVRIIGDRNALSERVQSHLARIEEDTAGGDRLTTLLAINYSARWEIAEMARRVAGDVASGKLDNTKIDAAAVASRLSTAGIPDPDLLVRSGGEMRLSNFLLWQCAYAELYFTDVLWPDFDGEEFDRALEVYATRKRRFGLLI